MNTQAQAVARVMLVQSTMFISLSLILSMERQQYIIMKGQKIVVSIPRKMQLIREYIRNFLLKSECTRYIKASQGGVRALIRVFFTIFRVNTQNASLTAISLLFQTLFSVVSRAPSEQKRDTLITIMMKVTLVANTTIIHAHLASIDPLIVKQRIKSMQIVMQDRATKLMVKIMPNHFLGGLMLYNVHVRLSTSQSRFLQITLFSAAFQFSFQITLLNPIYFPLSVRGLLVQLLSFSSQMDVIQYSPVCLPQVLSLLKGLGWAELRPVDSISVKDSSFLISGHNLDLKSSIYNAQQKQIIHVNIILNNQRSFSLSNGDLSLHHLLTLSLLLDVDGLLVCPELNVALTREIWTDSTVGSVGSSPSLGGSVHLHVVDCQVLQVLGVGVGLKVLEESEHSIHGLLGPSTECLSELFGLAGPSNTSVVFGVWNASPLGEDILEVSLGLGEGQPLDCLGCLVGVLVVNSEILG